MSQWVEWRGSTKYTTYEYEDVTLQWCVFNSPDVSNFLGKTFSIRLEMMDESVSRGQARFWLTRKDGGNTEVKTWSTTYNSERWDLESYAKDARKLICYCRMKVSFESDRAREREAERKQKEDMETCFNSAKCKAIARDISGALSDLEHVMRADWSYSQKASNDSGFDTMRDDCNRLIERLETTEKRKEQERRDAEERERQIKAAKAAAEEQRDKRSLILQIVAPIAVAGIYILLSVLFEDHLAFADMGFLANLFFIGAPFLVVSLVIGITNVCFNTNYGTIYVVVPLYVLGMAIVAANGILGFIGYLLLTSIIGAIFALPGWWVTGFFSKRK